MHQKYQHGQNVLLIDTKHEIKEISGQYVAYRFGLPSA